MPITAAQVEANGWVLRLTLTAALTSPDSDFGAYFFDANGIARLVLTASHPGFVKSGGMAVPGTLARTLVGTIPLRKPVNPASPTVKVLDETDLGGGSIQVRIALSETIYATDTGLLLSSLAGWRTGESAQAGFSVTNNSTIVAPIPIFRWVLAPYEVTAGSFRVSLLVFSHHPVGFEPVAGVKFTATDGTGVKTVWTTALGTDNSYGDNLRCYTAIIDPATATALTAGLLRVDAEVYPWLGLMRTTDVAGTRAMTTLRTDGFNVDAASPWVIGYDPAGDRYSAMWAFVDPVNGTATASAGMIATTLAGAKAMAPASRPIGVNTAIQAGYLANRTLAAANGQGAITRSVDGLNIVLSAGTNQVSSTSVTTGIQSLDIPVRVVGDPADANPRANCQLPTGASGIQRVTKMRYQNMTIRSGVNALGGGATCNLLDNVTVAGKTGSEASATGLFTLGVATASVWNLGATRSRFWKTGSVFGSGLPKVGLYRGNEQSLGLPTFLTAVKNRVIGNVEDGFLSAVYATAAFTTNIAATLAGQVEDIILAYTDARFLRGRLIGFGRLPAATAGTANDSLRRNVIYGNVAVRIGSNPQPFAGVGEDESVSATYNIFEANTCVGDRFNAIYSDPTPITIADTNTQKNQASVNRFANNAFDWNPVKHDDFDDLTTRTVRGTSDGYRPQMVEAWPAIFGVGAAGNYDTARANSGGFYQMYPGLRSVQNNLAAPVDPLFSDDNSITGPDGAGALGGGDYTPRAGSPLLGRTASGNSDRDFAGNARGEAGAAGAFEASAGVSFTVASGRHLQWAGMSAIGLALALAPAGAVLAHVVQGPALSMQAMVIPTGSLLGLRGTAAVISPDDGSTPVQPADSRLRFAGPTTLLLPDGSVPAERTLSVRLDARMNFVTQTRQEI